VSLLGGQLDEVAEQAQVRLDAIDLASGGPEMAEQHVAMILANVESWQASESVVGVGDHDLDVGQP
jgi:hypothetical protein